MGVLVRTAWAMALVALGCSSSSHDDNTSTQCLVGTERCACTEGGKCDPELVCRSHLCVRDPHATGAGGAGTVDGGTNPGGAGPKGGTNGTGFGQGGGGQGGAGNGASAGGATGNGGSAGTPAAQATCAFPEDFAFPKEGYDPTGSSKDSPQLTFSSGTLVTLDGQACTLDTSGVLPVGDWSPISYPCQDAYVCGGCLVFMVSEKAPTSHYGHWAFLGANAATSGQTAGCPTYSASYDTCVPDCVGKNCDDSDGCGGVCGCGVQGTCCSKSAHQCVTDACTQCISDCSDPSFPNPSNCCTSGAGCVCAGACPGPC